MSWEKELRNFGPEFGDFVQQKLASVGGTIADHERKCYGSAKNDVEKFVTCMIDESKKVDKAEKKFELALEFAQRKTAECFKKSAGEPLSMEECKGKARNLIDKAYSDLLKNIS